LTDDFLTDGICLRRQKHAREDGWLCELVSDIYDDEPFTGIHTYIVSVSPGRSRANHYHRKKEEWIAITSGKIILSLEWTDEEREEVEEDTVREGNSGKITEEKDTVREGNSGKITEEKDTVREGNSGKITEEKESGDKNKEEREKIRADIILDADDESGECRLIHIKPFVAHRITNISDRNSSVVVFSRNPEDKEDTIPYIIDQ
jgi:dTDP-4-dehydrorhamnose 3,5-epimerase-like enzyme